MAMNKSLGMPKMIPNPAYFSDEVVRMRLDQFKGELAQFGECVEDYFGNYVFYPLFLRFPQITS